VRHLSALEVAHLIWGRPSGRRVMVFIRAAFDSSKDHERGVTVVAGHIGDADTWATIDAPWNARLALEELESFHLSEVKQRFTKGAWLDIVRPFAAIIAKSALRGVSASLKDSDWAELNHDSAYLKECPHREHACLDMLWDVLHQERELQFGGEPVTIVFDKDWGNRDAVVRLHEAWSERTGRPGFNIFLKGDLSWDCVPLQAADMAAGLLRLNPFSRAWLNDESLAGHFDELSRVAANASGGSHRGTMWSKALAKRAEEALRKHGK
jgi:hypothetical protein